MNTQTMRAEKTCRTRPSEVQTEPYSACYDNKQFWRVPLKILVYARGANPGLKKGQSCSLPQRLAQPNQESNLKDQRKQLLPGGALDQILLLQLPPPVLLHQILQLFYVLI